MEKLTLKKKLLIVRLYLSGFSYSEISARAGVSKGTVANVVTDLKAGVLLNVQESADQLDLLRELAVDLGRLKTTPGQALVGITIISRLSDLGIEPADAQRWAEMCRNLAGEETDREVFMRAALTLEEIRKRTGLTFDSLLNKAQNLESEVSRLEPIGRQVQSCQHELEELKRQRDDLNKEVALLEERVQPVRQEVAGKEKREKELSQRIQNLERRGQAADERLAAARADLEKLSALGLNLDDLSGLTQRVSAVAQRHGIKPERLRDRLIRELEALDRGLSLETLVKERRQQLKEIEQSIAEDQQRGQSLQSQVFQRTQDLEEKAQAADERLAAARADLERLSALGLALNDVTGLVQRVSAVAQRHGVKPEQLRDWLFHELEGLDQGLSMDAQVKEKRRALNKVEQDIAEAQKRRQAVEAGLRQLDEQQASLRAAIEEQQQHFDQTLQNLTKAAQDAVIESKGRLTTGIEKAVAEVQTLTNQAVELGKELGRLETIIKGNQWLQTLASLNKGGASVSPQEVKVVTLATLKSVRDWYRRNHTKAPVPSGITTALDSAILEMERWKL